MAKYPKPVTKYYTKRILIQMNNISFGKISDSNQICFFTKIKFNTLNIPVMITNYQSINYAINNINFVNIYINNKLYKIEFGKAKYFNEDYNLGVIQIKENKKINYLECDDNLHESIYILNYNIENDIEVTYGIVKDINNSEILFSSYLNKNEKNIPIFNLYNNRFIGIQSMNNKYYNKGILYY